MSTKLLHTLLIATLVAASGCRNNSSLPVAPQVPNDRGAALFSVEILASQRAVAIGQTLALRVQGRDDRDTPIDVRAAQWKSSDPATATVDASGNVTGLKRGRVTITVTTSNPPREATLEVQVLGPGEQAPPGAGSGGLGSGGFGSGGLAPAPGGLDDPYGGQPTAGGVAPPAGIGLKIYPELPRVATGEQIRLVAMQGMLGAESLAAAVWRSSDATIATVDDAGVVVGKKTGTVTITASSLAYPALTRQVRLAVLAPAAPARIAGIRITPSRVTMNVGETFWLAAEVPTRDGGFDPLVRWEAGNPDVVRVSETGQVTAMGPGRTTITATAVGYKFGDLSATVPVEVRNVASSRFF